MASKTDTADIPFGFVRPVFVSGFIGWLADKGNEEIETYLKSEEIRTNKDIFTETRVVPKEQGE